MFGMRFLLHTPPRSALARQFVSSSTLQQRANFASQCWSALRVRPSRSNLTSRIRWQPQPRQQTRAYRRQAFNYQRFNTTRNYFQRWAARPTFYYELGGLGAACGGFYVINLETVPVSGRKRFNIVPASTEASQGQQMYAQTMQQFRGQIMSPLSKEHRLVQRVLNRLIPHSGLEGEQWEIHVIDDDMKNAFVIPGGKVFVFRGILDVAGYDEAGVAAVLGHEIAHNVAHHAAERMSQSAILLPIAIIGSMLIGLDVGIGNYISKLAFELPGSRAQESEADFIGLMMMAEACFNPKAAMDLWARMEVEEKGQAPPQFMSTHPSSHGRMERIREWLPQAQDRLENGQCGGLVGYASAFKSQVMDPARYRRY